MGKTLIHFQLIFVMMLWGFNVIAIKVIIGEFAPITITSLRILLAAIIICTFLWVKKQTRTPTKQEICYLLMISVTGVAGHHLFLAVGLTMTTASSSGLILATVPLCTTILASLMLKERVSFIKGTGIILGLVGVSFIVLTGNSSSLTLNNGDILIFVAVLFQAISFIFIKKATKTMQSSMVTGITLLVGSILLFVLSLGIEPHGLSGITDGSVIVWSIFLASAIFATAIGQFLYNNAIQHIGPGKSSIYMNFSPFFALLGSFLFLQEQITHEHFLGFILIVLGVLLGSGLVDNYFYRKGYSLLRKRG